MTIKDALAELATLWPEASFSIGVDVWSHFHENHVESTGRQLPTVEWDIYNSAERHSYRHGTLEGAMALARSAAATRGQGLSLVERADDAVASFGSDATIAGGLS